MARGETVYLVRPSGKGRFGDPNPGQPVRYEIPNALFAPGKSTEVLVGANQVETDGTLYPLHTLVTLVPGGPQPTDRFEVRGQMYEVVGDPQDWGVRQRMVIELKKVTG